MKRFIVAVVSIGCCFVGCGKSSTTNGHHGTRGPTDTTGPSTGAGAGTSQTTGAGAGNVTGSGGAATSSTSGNGTGGTGGTVTSSTTTSSTGTTPGGLACDFSAAHGFCEVAYGLDPATFDGNCMHAGGTAAPSCPTDGLLGTCDLVLGTPVTKYFYTNSMQTAAGLKSNCMSHSGTWHAP